MRNSRKKEDISKKNDKKKKILIYNKNYKILSNRDILILIEFSINIKNKN